MDRADDSFISLCQRGDLEQAVKLVKTNPGVLDEADEMLSMGFAKELNAIIERLPKERQTLLFSATVDRAMICAGRPARSQVA